jgi:hypothetical protein
VTHNTVSYERGAQARENHRHRLISARRQAMHDLQRAEQHLVALGQRQAALSAQVLTQAQTEASPQWLARGRKSQLPALRAEMAALLEQDGVFRLLARRARRDLAEAVGQLREFEAATPERQS